jgi:hypothetical protein
MKININERFYKNKKEQETSDAPKPEPPDTEIEGGGIEAPEISGGEPTGEEEEPDEGEEGLDMGDEDLELEEDAVREACAMCGAPHEGGCGMDPRPVPIRLRFGKD